MNLVLNMQFIQFFSHQQIMIPDKKSKVEKFQSQPNQLERVAAEMRASADFKISQILEPGR